ncbi:MAG: nucleotide exchange factor GrpE [Planctomycetes bacterium]|nr:nucleotide exchange factor GrpE [Planctomycetota bacterium]
MAARKTSTGKAATKSAAEPKAGSQKAAAPKPTRAARAASPPDTGGTRARRIAAKAAPSAACLLAQAEADVGKLLTSLNTQMAAAMHVFTELAAAQRGKHEAVIRTRPLDRATAMFQRLVTEVVEERFGEILPTLVVLRRELGQRAGVPAPHGPDDQTEFMARATEMLDQVLANADVQAYTPRPGDAFDPLIHLAVGETHRTDLAGDVVAEAFQPGYRSSRGKVIEPARVKVNRR